MPNSIIVKNKIKQFNKSIAVSGDKSISIRWLLFSSIADGISKAKNLLLSEDVIATINAVKKLGINVNYTKNICKVHGKGFNGYRYKKNIIINAENSGTLGRLLPGLLINSPDTIKLIGDKSLSKRDFRRISVPLNKFGANIKLKNGKHLPLFIKGSKELNQLNILKKEAQLNVKVQ